MPADPAPRPIQVSDLMPIVKQVQPYTLVTAETLIFSMQCVMSAIVQGHKA